MLTELEEELFQRFRHVKKDTQKEHQLKGRDLWNNKMNLACTGRHLRRCDKKL
jgi:hypothetical protein